MISLYNKSKNSNAFKMLNGLLRTTIYEGHEGYYVESDPLVLFIPVKDRVYQYKTIDYIIRTSLGIIARL
jgi:hypothetical protein